MLNAVVVKTEPNKSIGKYDPTKDGEYNATKVHAKVKVSVAGGGHNVTKENISELFQDAYDKRDMTKRGAKALTYRNSDGKLVVIFWQTSDGVQGTNVHHRDALATLVKEDAAKAEALNRDAAYVVHREEWERLTEESRDHNVFSDEILKRSQGFQLSTRTVNGKTKVVNIDVASSITNAQGTRGIPINAAELVARIQAVYEAIDPSVRDVKTIRIGNYHDIIFETPNPAPPKYLEKFQSEDFNYHGYFEYLMEQAGLPRVESVID